MSYVLTGTVVEYTPKGADGFGLVILKTRLIEVATGGLTEIKLQWRGPDERLAGKASGDNSSTFQGRNSA